MSINLVELSESTVETTKSAEEMLKTDTWNEWFDGSDMRGWWD